MLVAARNVHRVVRAAPSQCRLILLALRGWTARQVLVTVAATVGVGVLIGVPTVLIPNEIFTREIPVEPWSYPVWIVTSVLAGLLVATYVRPRREAGEGAEPGPPTDGSASRLGAVGGVLTWFAVGCPVCNKLVLLAVGYTGALTWFAPFQPLLAAAGLVLTAAALLTRLHGQVACSLPAVARG